MIRKLLATTALVTIAAGSAYAAEGQASDRFLTKADDAAMASTLIGESVYTSSSSDAESVGEINDLLGHSGLVLHNVEEARYGHDTFRVGGQFRIGQDGGPVEAAIIGVGGFLGLGEKNVAVSYDNLKLTPDEDGTYYVVLETSKEELESAPEFDVNAVMHKEAMAPEGKPADKMAAANKDAMATDKATADQQAMDREAVAAGRQDYAIVDVTTMGTDELIGASVYSYDNDNLGEIRRNHHRCRWFSRHRREARRCRIRGSRVPGR